MSADPASALPNPGPNAAWLARRVEDAIEPERRIVDAHHHLWDVAHPRYLFDEILADTRSGHCIEATVLVEARTLVRADGPEELRTVGEVEVANGVAAMGATGLYGPTRFCAAIVAHADLRLGDRVEPVLQALERAGGGRFRGVRHIAARDPDVRLQAPAGMLGTREFREGFARLQALGYTFDAWVYHPQLDEVFDLLRAFPEARVVLNHVGGRIGVGRYAARPDEVRHAWRNGLAKLAGFPGLHLKLGGLGMAMAGFGLHERAEPPSSDDLVALWRPFIETGIELFGPHRCMFESNFPVDKASCSYGILWNAFKKIAAPLSEADKDALFRATAARFYRIDGV